MIVDWSPAHGETAPDRQTHTHTDRQTERQTDSISCGEVALSTPLQRTETHTRTELKTNAWGRSDYRRFLLSNGFFDSQYLFVWLWHFQSHSAGSAYDNQLSMFYWQTGVLFCGHRVVSLSGHWFSDLGWYLAELLPSSGHKVS
jgi:hypothetical protein